MMGNNPVAPTTGNIMDLGGLGSMPTNMPNNNVEQLVNNTNLLNNSSSPSANSELVVRNQWTSAINELAFDIYIFFWKYIRVAYSHN